MTNYPNDFIDSSVKFRNISLGQNEKEMVSNSSPIVKTIIIDYFLETIKRQNLKNPVVVSGDAPTYSTFSYTATEGDKVTPKYTRGVSVIVNDWSASLKSIGDVLASEVYDYDEVRAPGESPRKIEETTYGWIETVNLEVTFWAINSSRGRDIGGQFIKRTMLEGQKSLHFIKNGIMSCVVNSGFDSNDTSLLKTNGSILYQHVTRWTLQTFFYINTTLYETETTIDSINFNPINSSNLDINTKPIIDNRMYDSSGNLIEYNTSGGIVYPIAYTDDPSYNITNRNKRPTIYELAILNPGMTREQFDNLIKLYIQEDKKLFASTNSVRSYSADSHEDIYIRDVLNSLTYNLPTPSPVTTTTPTTTTTTTTSTTTTTTSI